MWLEVRDKNLIEDPIIDGILVDARDITKRKEYEDNLAVLTESLSELFLSDSQIGVIDQGRDIASRMINNASFDFYLIESNERLIPVPTTASTDDADSLKGISLDGA